MSKKRMGIGAVVIGMALASVSVANAATTINIGTYPSMGSNASFYISNGANPYTSDYITANFSNGFIGAVSFDDIFTFEIPTKSGVGSGSISTSSSSKSTLTTISALLINGKNYCTAGCTTMTVSDVPITAGTENTIEVIGTTSKGGGTFSGTATFSAAVPEASTWAMMIVGLGMVGASMRRRKSSAAKLATA